MEIKVLASGSSGNCYLVHDGTSSILLDAGIPIRNIQIGCKFKLSQIDGCLISHAHGDHVKAASALAQKGIDIHTSQGTIDCAELAGHRIHAVQAKQPFKVGTFIVLPFDVQHDIPEPLGFFITSVASRENLLYITDSYYIKYVFKDLNYIMLEANYSEVILKKLICEGKMTESRAKRLIRSHMSIENALDLLRTNDLSKVKQIYLLHLSNDNSNANEFKEAVQKLTGAEVYVGQVNDIELRKECFE